MSSLLKVKNLTRVFRRRLTLPNDGMPLNPNPIIEEFVRKLINFILHVLQLWYSEWSFDFAEEKHAGHLVKPAWISLLFIIPPLSVYAFYLEYQHLFVHRHRRPFPKMYFLHQGVNVSIRVVYQIGT